MIRRTFDPTLLNEVVNHPDVLPWTGSKVPLDLSGAITNPLNFTLVTEGGGFLLVCQEPAIYEVHSLFVPEARRATIRAMKAGFDYMFTRTDCERVITQVPDNNRAAQALAKLARFRSMFRREDTPRGPTAYVGLTVEDWAQDNACLEVEGRWFHETTSAALKHLDLPAHPDDVSHDRVVGASVRMIRAGNIRKGVNFYNRWARFAGYTPIRIMSEQPVVLDMSEREVSYVVEIKDGEMETLICR